MKIYKLKTPFSFDPGHGGRAETYSAVRLVEVTISLEREEIILLTRYGNMVNGQWVAGKAAERREVIENTHDQEVNGRNVPGVKDYDALADIAEDLVETLYTRHLKVRVAAYDGTIE